VCSHVCALTNSCLQEQDRVLRSFPEVESVFGAVGRSDSATDNAPLDMYDTTVMLKPRENWRPGMTYEKLVEEMDAKLQFPGLTNTWTMPVQNRLDMALTGIKTPIGMKLQGTNLEQIQQLGMQVQQILSSLPQVRSVFAERVSQGFYVNVDVNRPDAAKYGLTIADVQQAVESGIGGMNVAENIEGRRRYPINVRYQRDFRDNVQELSRVLIATPSGAQIPISEVARVSFSRGPAMIRDEDGQLTGYIYINLNTADYRGFVHQASDVLRQRLQLPAGYTYQWSGEYEFQLRAKERLKIILPVVFFVIFLTAVYGLSLGDRGNGADFSHVLRDDRRADSPMAPWIQLQCCSLGGIHRAVWHRGGNGRSDGRVSPRITGETDCVRSSAQQCRYSRSCH